MKFIFTIVVLVFFTSCGTTIQREDVEGCWIVSYIDTDGVKVKAGDYQMCFEEDGVLISQKADGTQKVTAEWNLEENDSAMVIHYSGSAMPDTARIIKIEAEEMHLKIRKKSTYITLYLRKEK